MCLHSHLSWEPRDMAQPKMTSSCAPNTRLSVPLALKGPHPRWLYLKMLSLHACPVCVFACVCACMSVLTCALGPADYSSWRPGRHHNLSSSPALSHSAPEPSMLVSPGPEGPQASRAVGEGRGGPPLLPLTPVLGWSVWSSPTGRWGEWGGLQEVVPIADKS